jgi:hypothetical protein
MDSKENQGLPLITLMTLIRKTGDAEIGKSVIGTSGDRNQERFTAKDAEDAKENQGLPLIHADDTDQENRTIGKARTYR